MRRLVLIVALAALAADLGCSTSSTTVITSPPVLKSIQVAAQNTNVTVGDSDQLTATGTYSDNTTKDLTSSVTWSSSNLGLATVSSSGVLSAVASGSVSITATVNSVSGSLKLSIAPKLESIAVTTNLATIATNTTTQFTATGTYSDNSQQNITSSVTWSSSNTGVATISSSVPTSGLATGVTSGKVTITATSGLISGTATLTVNNVAPISLAITPASPSLPLDNSQQLKATVTFADNTQQDVTNVTAWSSSASGTVSITTSGLVTGKNLGSSTITASFNSTSTSTTVSNSTTVTVNASNLSSIAVQPANATIAQGTKIQFTAIGTFTDGSTHNLTTLVNWTSSNTSVASMSGNLATGQTVAASTPPVTVSAMMPSTTITGSTSLTVTNATISSMVITPSSLSVPAGWRQSLSATGQFSDGSSQDLTISATWSSDNLSAATVGTSGSNSGVVTTANPAGASNIANIMAAFSAAGSSASKSAQVTVDSTATLSSISVNPSGTLIAPGAVLQMNAKATWSDGATENVNSQATWSSSNNQVATVNTGAVTGQSTGTANITAQLSSISNSASVIVEGSSLTSIQVSPQSVMVPATIQTRFTATGTFNDGKIIDISSAVTWTSSTPSIATISNQLGSIGVATGVAQGATTITASFAGVSATATLNVTNATLTSIDVTPTSQAISAGQTQQFTATGNFNDRSTVNITSQAAWSSGNVNIATVNAVGLATGLAQGSTTISATLNGQKGSATLNVN